ncbi:MAG: cold shock domain-containing protein [Rhodospirillaceae bacterium]
MSRFSQQNAPSPGNEGAQAKALVKWFNVTKGFGFVAPVDGSPDAFLHISVLNRAGLQELADGTEIECEIAPGPKGPQVTRIVEVTGGAPSGPSAYEGGRHRRDADSAPGPVVEMAGTVKWFKPDKGFGFVTADDSSKDVFVHKSVLRRCGLNQLEAGQRVQMKVQEAEKGREATWILPI